LGQFRWIKYIIKKLLLKKKMLKKVSQFESVVQRIYAAKWIAFTTTSIDSRSTVYRGYKHYVRVAKGRAINLLRRCHSKENRIAAQQKVVFTHLLTHSLAYLLTHSLAYLLTHSLAYLLTYSLNLLFTGNLAQL
jgi:hypothetical protein